ncbi:MAG: MBL fold metallo-hydrolase [Actinobacteria bacterium]|nr:MAG: MBL fold metallo-hydrolase [Actinomycetota bacterium]
MNRLAELDIARHRAENPSALTLSGTNTWVLGRQPAFVIDPGPALAEHLAAVAEDVAGRGGLGGVAITHSHVDHVEGLAGLLERCGPAPTAGAGSGWDTQLTDGGRFGPLVARSTPGHADDHLAYLSAGACFTGDAVLGEGSVFVAPEPGALAGYLDALRGLRELDLQVLCPGHGPPIADPRAKLDEYLAHREDRERRLLGALDRGLRDPDELLDVVWDDAPAELRPPAALTLTAHLHKLAEEGRLPADVVWPALPGDLRPG